MSAPARLLGEADTVALARRVAAIARAGDVIALSGDLGAGKSVFARGFVRGLIPDVDEVPSPTFTLVQVYEAPRFDIHHFDLYRLEKPDDALELGIEDAFADGVSLIEWPERLGRLLPAGRLDVTLGLVPDEDDARTLALAGTGAWHGRLSEAGLD